MRRRATPRDESRSGKKRAPDSLRADYETDDFPADDLPPDDLPVQDIHEDWEKLHSARDVGDPAVSRHFPGQGSSIADPCMNTPEHTRDLPDRTESDPSAVLVHDACFKVSPNSADAAPEAAVAQLQYVLPGLVPMEDERYPKQATRSRRSRGSRVKDVLTPSQIELWLDEER
jgi:hypothetical protein